jgi:rubrerythrin
MSSKHWTLDDIPWGRFDGSKVDPEILKIIKAASLVEFNGGEYAIYLCNVFLDDAGFQAAARQWAREEEQHGEALAQWAKMADLDFDFDTAFSRFTEGYRLPLEATQSVRGSRSGELVARCIVEVGTSSYYGSLRDTVEEPVLRAICHKIAADELRHYKFFYTHLRRYLEKEKISKLRRLVIAMSRVRETEDDELAYAFYAANAAPDEPYDRKTWSAAYMGRAYAVYRQKHVQHAAAMICKAAGLDPKRRYVDWVSRGAYKLMRNRAERLAAAGGLAA